MHFKPAPVLIALLALVALPLTLWAGGNQSPPFSPHVFEESPAFWIGLSAAGLGLFALDAPIRDLAGRDEVHSDAANRILNDGVEHLGEVYPLALAFAGFAAKGVLSNDRRAYRIAAEIAAAPAICQALAGTVKEVSGRLRPGQTDQPGMWREGGSSFISGHSITAWTLATVLAKNFPNQDADWLGLDDPQPVVPVICYTCATLVSIQRVYDKRHWSSDVYYGALAGYFSGSAAVWLGERYFPDRLTVSLGNPVSIRLNW